MKNNYRCCNLVVLIPLLYSFFFLGKMTAAPYFTISSSKILKFESFFQQQISGTVRDKDGVPIPGVNVVNQGSSNGTMTNLDGEYSIIANVGDSLVFSYIGFKEFRIEVSDTFTGEVTLESSVDALEEVVINAGYYNTTRREQTGNIARVTADEIELQPVTSPIEALQGRMAGVEIIPNGNLPGNASTIRIRGTNSLREEGNLPLYIIDGVPVNSAPIESYTNLGNVGIDPLNALNLGNIKSIEVLKDADATAIYGSRGANGVILITTKSGKSGKTSLHAGVYTGVSKVNQRVDLLNTQEYLDVRRRAFENDGVELTESNAYDLLIWDQERYTDWQDVFFGGTANVTSVNLSANGGNGNTNYRINGSYFQQGTIYMGDYNYRKLTGGFQLNHKSENRKFHLDLALNYGVDRNKTVGYMDLSESAFRLPPNAPNLFDINGDLEWEEWSEVGINNPLNGFYNKSLIQNNNMNSNLVLTYEVLKGLKLKTNMGYTIYHGDEIVRRPKTSYNPSSWESINNRSNHLKTLRDSWIIEPQLLYTKSLGKVGIESIIGGTFQESNSSYLGLSGTGYVSDALIGNLNAAEEVTAPMDENSEYRYNAIFGRIKFDLNDKYYLNFTGRRDGSSRFGTGKRWANFGAIGAAWIFSEESFIARHLSFLSFGKFRASYGTTGNDQIGDYGYLDAYESTIGPGGLYPNQLANPNYSWEVNKKLEAAIELGFFENDINLNLSWYRNRSSNQLVGYSLPATTGFNSVQANLPATVENTGLEVEFAANILNSDNVSWHLNINFTIPQNKLVNYPNLEESSYANTYKIGYPLNISLLYQYDGVNPETGFYQVVDQNNDERIDYEDRIIPWDRGRQFFGGFSNTIGYKGFSLQFLMQYVNQEGRLTLFEAGYSENQRAEVIDALNEGSRFQMVSRSTAASRAYSEVIESDFPIVDASFLRLKTISLSYALPETLTKNLGLTAGKLFINGQNLWTLTPYKGMDPEQPGRGSEFANLQSITGGIQFNF